MKWGKQTYHGVIIKINDNEEELTRFANQAYSKLLKNLEEKPNDVPEGLFNFNLDTEKAKGKRTRVPTDKIKECKEQDEELSPKKKKKNTENTKEKKQELSPKKKKIQSQKTPAKERSEKKKMEEAAAQKSAVYLSDVLTQFIDTTETTRPKSPTDLVVSAGTGNEELQDLQNQTSSQSLQCSTQPLLPTVQPLIPSTQQLIPSTKPQLQSFTQPLLHSTPPPLLSTQPLLFSAQSSTSLPQLQPVSLTTTPSTSLLETWSLCRQSTGTSIEENSKGIPVPSAEVLHVMRGLQRADVQHFITNVVEHFESSSCYHVGNECFETSNNNTWAPNSEPYWGVEESDEPQVLSLPQISPLRRSPRKRQRATLLPLSEDLQTHDIPSQKSPLRRSPRKHATTTILLPVDDNSISSPGESEVRS
ncbi:uncharacterized protein LOC130049677 [Ostrea edulis]|uniref:uncharacterized protein LOC130049677 n=1 Tax=Ostrea edulis TaxID=37623 RepID=UPI0024AF23C7|nr:uncharacterized protein LOC130049677 [Ostrea edulis]